LDCHRRNTDTFRDTASRGKFSQVEIEHFGMTALGDEQVCRFDIAMDDTFGVGCVERVCDLDS